MSKKFSFLNSRSQKFKLLAVGAILFSFGVATSAVATSAWYNLLDIAVVSNLNLKIDISDAKLELGLKSKVDGEMVWSGDENHPDGFSREELGITDTLLRDVSGMYESDWLNESTDLNTAMPNFHTRYRPGANPRHNGYISEQEVEKNIVQVEFTFYSEGYDMDVYLDESTSFSPNSKMNYDKAKEKASDKNDENEVYRIKDKLDKVIYATRMSFLSNDGYIIINPYKGLDIIGDEVETYYGGILDLNKDGFYDYSDNKEILYGELIDDSIPIPYLGLGSSEDDYKKDVTKYNTFQGEHKKDVQMVDENSIKENIRMENSKSLKQVVFDYNDPLKDTPICRLTKGVEKRVVMSIYVEGWDRHMTDDIASATFDVNIAFTGLVK